MALGDNSLVIINECPREGASFEKIIDVCQKKASLFGIWEGAGKVDETDKGFPLAKFLFDRMLGANQLNPKSPPQRPFDYRSVFDYMVSQGMATAEGVTFALFPGDHGDCGMLLPSIQNLGVMEEKDELHVVGLFGEQPKGVSAKVLICQEDPTSGSSSAKELAIKDWAATEIICELPPDGEGSAGYVIVEVEGRTSNARALTEWRTTFTHSATVVFDGWSGEQWERYVFDTHWRLDIQSFRLNPEEEPQELKAPSYADMPYRADYLLVHDSKATYDASSYWADEKGPIVKREKAGESDLVLSLVAERPIALGGRSWWGGLWVDTAKDKSSVFISFFALVPSGVLEAWYDAPNHTWFKGIPRDLRGDLVFTLFNEPSQLEKQLLKMPFDQAYIIQSGGREYKSPASKFLTTYRVVWDTIRPRFPPITDAAR